MAISDHDNSERLPTGYEGQNVPTDFNIPSCGIEDVDVALFNLFNQKIKFNTLVQSEVRKVPVIFATGERFALIKNKKPLRDKLGLLILPLISIRRTGIDQSEDWSGRGRGMGQDVGDLVIKRRLSKSDRDYQRLTNRLDLINQDDVSSTLNELGTTSPEGSLPGRVATRRDTGQLAERKSRGEVLANELGDNIYEIITIPFPQHFTCKYEITFWTEYIQNMNQMIETFMNAYDGQHNQFRIDTDKGYWFVAFVDNDLSSKDNFDDFTDNERMIRYSFNITATGYLINPDHAGQMNALRKYVSAPMISFDVSDASTQIVDARRGGAGSGDPDDFVLTDVTQLDKYGKPQLGRNHSSLQALEVVVNPFDNSTAKVYNRVLSRNQRRGETVVSSRVVTKIEDIT